MTILTIRTDRPDSEIGLYEDKVQLGYGVWQAHRQLAETIHNKLEALLQQAGKQLGDIEGIVVFQGPGSFTGLRIGISTANALAYGLEIPIVASQDDWITGGIERLLAGQSDHVILPKYGAPVHITQQKK